MTFAPDYIEEQALIEISRLQRAAMELKETTDEEAADTADDGE